MGLVEHAEREMRLAGLYDRCADYGGMIPEAVMNVVRPFAAEGHSGGSASLCLSILDRVLRFKTLTPIDSNPEHWMQVGDKAWQSTRDPSYFSEDGGKTFYCLDDPEEKNFPERLRSAKSG